MTRLVSAVAAACLLVASNASAEPVLRSRSGARWALTNLCCSGFTTAQYFDIQSCSAGPCHSQYNVGQYATHGYRLESSSTADYGFLAARCYLGYQAGYNELNREARADARFTDDITLHGASGAARIRFTLQATGVIYEPSSCGLLGSGSLDIQMRLNGAIAFDAELVRPFSGETVLTTPWLSATFGVPFEVNFYILAESARMLMCQSDEQQALCDFSTAGRGVRIIRVDVLSELPQGGFGPPAAPIEVQTSSGASYAPGYTQCVADIDGDGAVGFSDLNEIVSRFNSTQGQPAYSVTADLDADGSIDFADLNIVVARFNTDC